MSEELKKFRMPAEWEPQKSVWIAWPYNKNDWPGLYKFIPKVILEIIFIISKSLKVNLIVTKKNTNIKKSKTKRTTNKQTNKQTKNKQRKQTTYKT